jgi:NADH/NAD ratio-sensing transcriptional regulator Rex
LREFAKDAVEHSKDLRKILGEYKSSNFTIFGLGASTKGNVLLQWAGLNSSTIESIGDINPKKFGKQTPGTCIDIVSENEVLESAASNVLVVVMPWHFRDGIVKNSMRYLENGGKLLFPLPRIEIVC